MGIYGVLFGDKHTYKDWRLIPKSRPVVSPPEVKTLYVDIPGADGAMDLTQALTDDVKYRNRKISFEFFVLEARKRWSTIYSEIMGYLHGQSMQIILDEDPDYYYTGRIQVNAWKSDKKTSTITIEADVEPYKLSRISTTEPWLWDTFNFETGIITNYNAMPFDSVATPGQRFYCIVTGRKWIVPEFTVTSSGGADITLGVSTPKGWKSIVCPSGVSTKNYNVVWSAGRWIVQLNTQASGTITINYRTGRL